MKKAKLFLIATLLELSVLTGFLLLMRGAANAAGPGEEAAKAELARELGLTDLAIWTEARYTRHPSQADFFSAFQDTPGALEHFPAGSVVSPPAGSWIPAQVERTDTGE